MSAEIYYNGNILTMEDRHMPEALLVQGGKISALGTVSELQQLASDSVKINLQGQTLMPGFIDAHSHIVQFALSLRYVSLNGVTDFNELCSRLTAYAVDRRIEAGTWIIGFGYDPTLLAEKTHPTKKILDASFPENPVIVSHISGHMGCLNSKAMEALGLSPSCQDGYFEEQQFMNLSAAVPKLTTEEALDLLDQAQDIYQKFGITTAQEGYAKAYEWDLLRAAAAAGRLKMDIIAYIDIKDNADLLTKHSGYLGQYKNHLKLGGYKLFLDGSPQARTAWMTKPYLPLHAGEAQCFGHAVYTREEAQALVEIARKADVQLLTHCNGDAAIDLLLDCYPEPVSSRDVIVHAQMIRQDQLERAKSLGLMPSFFISHIYYWGDTHIANLGRERADRISPAESCVKIKLPFTFHTDTPVLPPHLLEAVQHAVQRKTASGVLLDQKEIPSVLEALKAITVYGAWQAFEENSKGTLAPGKTADFAILDRNPLTTPADELQSIITNSKIVE